MLAFLRTLFIIIYSLSVCILGSLYCIFYPKKFSHVQKFSKIFGLLSYILGIKIKIRKPKNYINNIKNAMYIANHQNNYDMIVMGNVVQKNTITIGKKNLLWIPFFGILYLLSGNLIIDRNNHIKSRNIMKKMLFFLKKYKISFWIFPEGTRSYGRGILPFKKGAFYVAKKAKIPIIPIIVSNLHKKIKLNRLNNGIIIIEILNPINTKNFKSIKKLSFFCHKLMSKKFKILNQEIENHSRIIN